MIRPPPRSPLFPSTPPSRPGLQRRPLRPPWGSRLGVRPVALLRLGVRPAPLLRRGGLPGSRDFPGHPLEPPDEDRKSTRLNSSHLVISYAVFCLKKKKKHIT